VTLPEQPGLECLDRGDGERVGPDVHDTRNDRLEQLLYVILGNSRHSNSAP
jgi:hypothetical protein